VLILIAEGSAADCHALVADARRRALSRRDDLVSAGGQVAVDRIGGALHVYVAIRSTDAGPIDAYVAAHPGIDASATILTANGDDQWRADFARGLRTCAWRRIHVPTGLTRMAITGPGPELDRFAGMTGAPSEDDLELLAWRSSELERHVDRDVVRLEHYAQDVRKMPAFLTGLSRRFPPLTFRAEIAANDRTEPRVKAVLVAGAAVDDWTRAHHDE